jgi:hypothetical protein
MKAVSPVAPAMTYALSTKVILIIHSKEARQYYQMQPMATTRMVSLIRLRSIVSVFCQPNIELSRFGFEPFLGVKASYQRL